VQVEKSNASEWPWCQLAIEPSSFRALEAIPAVRLESIFKEST
jgi:hypothetical protein